MVILSSNQQVTTGHYYKSVLRHVDFFPTKSKIMTVIILLLFIYLFIYLLSG